MFSKEARKELAQYRVELKKKELERKQLIKSKMDFGVLEEFIMKCNSNPGLHVKFTLADGTIVDMFSEKDLAAKRNPLFTDAVYDEEAVN